MQRAGGKSNLERETVLVEDSSISQDRVLTVRLCRAALSSEPNMSIDELIRHMSPGLFVPNLKARSKVDVLEELTEVVVSGSNTKNKAVVLELLHNRERLGSTALESGVAFPHGRSLAVRELTIAVGRSSDGVDFDSEDGKPTHLFFLLLAPPHDAGNYYLQALGKIATLLRNREVREKLMTVTDFDTLVATLQEAS